MKNKILILGLSLFGQFAFAQVWVESSTYGENALDTGRWTQYSSLWAGGFSLDFSGSNLRIVRDNAMPQLDGYCGFDWYRTIPTTHDWTIYQRFKIDSSVGASPQGGGTLGQASLGVTSGLGRSFIQYDYTADNTFINNAGVTHIGGNIEDHTADFTLFTESYDFRWLALAYTSTNGVLRLQYSLSNSSVIPDSSLFQTRSTTSLGAVNDVRVTTGVTLYSGSIEFGDFIIVPEPSSLSLFLVAGVVLMVGRRRNCKNHLAKTVARPKGILGGIFLGATVLTAVAQAKIGETVQEIEKRVGKLEEATFKYTGIRLFRAHNKSGFTQTDYMFFKADDPQTAKCIGVMYLKVFSEGDQKITLEEAKKTIQENLPTFPVGFKVGPMKNVSDKGWGLSTTGDLWEVYWAIPNGGASASAVNLASPSAIVISCLSYRYVWFDAAENGISLGGFTDSEKAESGCPPHK